MTANALDSVVASQALIENREIRINQRTHRQIMLYRPGQISLSLQRQVVVGDVVVLRIHLRRRARLIKVPQLQPLGAKRLNHSLALVIHEHPLDLELQALALEFIAPCQRHEWFVSN